MKNPRELHYIYYHCTKSQNPGCPELGIERKELDRQLIQILTKIRVPLLHELWLNRSFARLSGSQEELDTLTFVRKSFHTATPEVQRQIAVAVFSGMVLKDQKLAVTLKFPFLLREHELPCPARLISTPLVRRRCNSRWPEREDRYPNAWESSRAEDRRLVTVSCSRSTSNALVSVPVSRFSWLLVSQFLALVAM
jgi:hypothetical protein